VDNPDIGLEFVTLGEGELRQKVTTDVATGAGQYDVVALGAYETAIWAEKGLLLPLDDLPEDYEQDDLLPTVRKSLTYDGTLHALPFYAESTCTMVRSDLLEQAGLSLPDQPTWDDVLEVAQALDGGDGGHGAGLRGTPGWGENMALLTAMANSFGGRWFDEKWNPQLTSDPWKQALEMYLALGAVAPDDAVVNGFAEGVELFGGGQCGIWVDSTAAAGPLTDPDQSQVADSVSIAPAPTGGSHKCAAWLWTWSLAVPAGTHRPDEAMAFAQWATSTAYTELVAQEYGWTNVPPGTRASLYERTEYQDAAPFASLVKDAIDAADLENPTVDPVPYTGIQYVGIPEFQGIGTAVGNQVADALRGEVSADEALENSQWVTEKVIARTRLTNEEDS
jgi:sorbitol/mannitol transport system substrate-binding protein